MESEARERKTSDDAAIRGNEKSQEMRGRRDERKEIMDDYRSDDRSTRDSDADDLEESAKSKEKATRKPWWKFWGD